MSARRAVVVLACGCTATLTAQQTGAWRKGRRLTIGCPVHRVQTHTTRRTP